MRMLMTVQENATTGQLSYHGTFAELTEAISNLPAGGQTLLSNHTYLLAANQLHKSTEVPGNSKRPKVGASCSVYEWP